MTQHYDIKHNEDGMIEAGNGLLDVKILPDGESRAFNRKAIRLNSQNLTELGRDSAFVAELDGVRVYIRGMEIVITKQDLYL
jgi:hypothetical protein